jgi:hypothetical protein
MSHRKSQSQNSRPSFQERIQNHPFTVVIGACVAVVSITFGVARYFSHQDIKQITAKYEQENTELRKRIVSIERRIGDQKYFDITKFFIDRSNAGGLYEKAIFFPEEKFYAFSDNSKWKHEKNQWKRFSTLYSW